MTHGSCDVEVHFEVSLKSSHRPVCLPFELHQSKLWTSVPEARIPDGTFASDSGDKHAGEVGLPPRRLDWSRVRRKRAWGRVRRKRALAQSLECPPTTQIPPFPRVGLRARVGILWNFLLRRALRDASADWLVAAGSSEEYSQRAFFVGSQSCVIEGSQSCVPVACFNLSFRPPWFPSSDCEASCGVPRSWGDLWSLNSAKGLEGCCDACRCLQMLADGRGGSGALFLLCGIPCTHGVSDWKSMSHQI